MEKLHKMYNIYSDVVLHLHKLKDQMKYVIDLEDRKDRLHFL